MQYPKYQKELLNVTDFFLIYLQHPKYQKELLNVTDFLNQGDHIRSVKVHPEWAGEPRNISFKSVPEHLQSLGGNWQNPTWGELIER